MSAERECARCHAVKELTLANFYRRPSKNPCFQHTCRKCRDAGKRRGGLAAARRGRPVKQGNVCGECYDLSHRVEGPKCWSCELEYAPLPPLDLADYLYRAPEREIV